MMISKAKNELIKLLLPKEIETLNPKKMTKDDMLIAIGWNMYRERLLYILKIRNLF